MLKNKENIYPDTFKYMGKDNGLNCYVVPIRENSGKRKKEINLDDALLEDFPDDYYNGSWQDEPRKAENELEQIDFFRMDYKESLFCIYKQLVNLSSIISHIQEVVSYGNEER